MAGGMRTNLLICWALGVAATIANSCLDNTWYLIEIVLYAPEAASREQRFIYHC